MGELEKLGPKYRIALKIIKDPRFERLTCTHKGTYADDCIVQRVTQVIILILDVLYLFFVLYVTLFLLAQVLHCRYMRQGSEKTYSKNSWCTYHVPFAASLHG